MFILKLLTTDKKKYNKNFPKKNNIPQLRVLRVPPESNKKSEKEIKNPLSQLVCACVCVCVLKKENKERKGKDKKIKTQSLGNLLFLLKR